jgi:hypothetical protein
MCERTPFSVKLSVYSLLPSMSLGKMFLVQFSLFCIKLDRSSLTNTFILGSIS